MKRYTQEEINKIVKLHGKFLRYEEGGIRAFLRGVDLRGVDLRGVDLRHADLKRVVLEDANLTGANLMSANLEDSNLTGVVLEDANLLNTNLARVNLEDAKLMRANLEDANLLSINLYNTIGNSKEIKTYQFEQYIVNITEDVIQIGCKQHTFEEWKNFSDKEISVMDCGALEFWKKHKEIILNLFKLNLDN